MVQILPAIQRRSTGEQLAQGLGQGINAALQMYGEHQKQKKFSQAIQGVEDVYNNPNLTNEQKYIKAFSLLKNHPEAAKQFSAGLSQVNETPLQKAQRLKLEQDLKESQGEESYLNRLMGGDQNQEDSENQFDESEMASEEITPKKASKRQFDYQDPSTWTDKQINNFRGLEGKSAKAKSLAKRAQNEYESRQETKTAKSKYQETVAPLESALDVIGSMEKLGKKGNLGVGTRARGIVSPKTRKDAAEYERLGKSLIQFSSNIPIRNRQEFETLAHDLYDPSISDDARAGILSAMRKIIQSSIQGVVSPEEEGDQSRTGQVSSKNAKKEKPALTSFLR